jgi:hypothetical protein
VIRDGEVLPNPEEAEVTITDGAGTTCTFENSFDASGEIGIEKETLGGVTTTGFVIWPVGDPEKRYRKSATTERPGEPARAEGSSTDHLPLGSYVIQALEPASNADRNWSLVEVVCNGRVVPAIEGRVGVTLTRDRLTSPAGSSTRWSTCRCRSPRRAPARSSPIGSRSATSARRRPRGS